MVRGFVAITAVAVGLVNPPAETSAKCTAGVVTGVVTGAAVGPAASPLAILVDRRVPPAVSVFQSDPLSVILLLILFFL